MTNEVKQQMDTLSLQAEQAKEFRELSEEARGLELKIQRAKLNKLEDKKEAITKQKSASDEAISNWEKEILSVASHQKKTNSESSAFEDAIAELDRRNYITKTELQATTSSQDRIQSVISNIDHFIERVENETDLPGE